MKLTVKRKVANGLVIGFLVPHVAGMVSGALDFDLGGLDAYAADDEFDIETVPGGSPEVMVAVADPCDPSGVDPSGINTVCFDPSGGLPTLCITTPTELVTAEDGTADYFEIYSEVDPSGSHVYKFESTQPNEALPITEAVVLGYDACEPHQVWVGGQDDGEIDGDWDYDIRVVSELGHTVAWVPGVNLDNDQIRDLGVHVSGPSHLPIGGSAHYDVWVYNIHPERSVTGHDLLIEASPGLEIGSFVVTSGAFKGKPKLTKSGALLLQQIDLGPDASIGVSVDVTMISGGMTPQSIRARFVNRQSGAQNDNSVNVRTSLR